MPKFFPIIFVHGWGGPADIVRDFGAIATCQRDDLGVARGDALFTQLPMGVDPDLEAVLHIRARLPGDQHQARATFTIGQQTRRVQIAIRTLRDAGHSYDLPLA